MVEAAELLTAALALGLSQGATLGLREQVTGGPELEPASLPKDQPHSTHALDPLLAQEQVPMSLAPEDAPGPSQVVRTQGPVLCFQGGTA